VEGVRDQDNAPDPFGAEEPSGGQERLPRAVARRFTLDRGVGDPAGVEVVGSGAGFGEAVAGLLATSDHDDRCDAAQIEVGGVVEPGPEVG
jgi:hypothetical protein